MAHYTGAIPEVKALGKKETSGPQRSPVVGRVPPLFYFFILVRVAFSFEAPSSSGLGLRPFTPATRVRVP